MLTAFLRAFRTPDLRRKLLFTLFIIAVFRLGSALPAPGVSEKNISACIGLENGSSQAGVYQLVNLFSGGALLRLSVFALGIMPYITASIILQLLTVVIPRLEALKEEGQAGQSKITQYTRYLTVGLAILQSTGIVALARSGKLFTGCDKQLLHDSGIFTQGTIVICMTAGTAVIMWLGELITDRGVGNGMSILIFTQVIAVIPGEMVNIGRVKGTFILGVVVVIGIAIIAGVVFVEQAQRLIPVIFASSLLYIPQLASSLLGDQKRPSGWVNWINGHLVKSDHPIYMLTFFVLILFFTYFYVAITFNPVEVADNMKKVGGFIPGIRPGRPTAEYLNYVLTRITAPGSVYLGFIALIPMVALAVVGASNQFPFGGTSILITVGVGLDTVKQIESQLQQRNYEGFLR